MQFHYMLGHVRSRNGPAIVPVKTRQVKPATLTAWCLGRVGHRARMRVYARRKRKPDYARAARAARSSTAPMMRRRSSRGILSFMRTPGTRTQTERESLDALINAVR